MQNCGHPVDILCNHCPKPARTERQQRIDHLGAKLLGLHLYGKTEADREEASRIYEEHQALCREENAS